MPSTRWSPCAPGSTCCRRTPATFRSASSDTTTGRCSESLLVADGRPDAYVLMAPDATFANWFVKYLLGGRGSASEYQAAFAPLDPVNYVGEAGAAPVFFQFAKSDPYVPGYIADKFVEAAPDAEEGDYDGGHELDDKARGRPARLAPRAARTRLVAARRRRRTPFPSRTNTRPSVRGRSSSRGAHRPPGRRPRSPRRRATP